MSPAATIDTVTPAFPLEDGEAVAPAVELVGELVGELDGDKLAVGVAAGLAQPHSSATSTPTMAIRPAVRKLYTLESDLTEPPRTGSKFELARVSVEWASRA
jgi:hypothetical protein